MAMAATYPLPPPGPPMGAIGGGGGGGAIMRGPNGGMVGVGGGGGGGAIRGPNGGVIAGGAVGGGAVARPPQGPGGPQMSQVGMGGGGVVAGGGTAGGCVACGCGEGQDAAILSYVGCGGNWKAETTYYYVGGGAGDFDMVLVPTRWWIKFVWMAVLSALALLLFLLMKTSQTTTTTPPCPPKTCLIYGDPHIETFDHKHANYYTAGEYWLVKSDTVIIQGKYAVTQSVNLAVTKEIAVGGSFLKGNVLIIGALSATWNNQPILQTFPMTQVLGGGLVTIEYNCHGSYLQKGREGKDLKVVHVHLPLGITLQINQWNEPGEGNYINTQITMSRQPNQDGQCGNFNGNPIDDARIAVRARMGKNGVPQADLLFPGPKTPINPGKRFDLNDCADTKLEEATNMCKKKEHKWNPSQDCLFDCCFGGPQFAKEDIM